MLISPEEYYQSQLKGKTAAQLLRVIRGLKNEMGHLKRLLEAPSCFQEELVYPDESVRLACTRLYLQRAQQALVEAGGRYLPSRAEVRAAALEARLPAICRLRLTIGGYLEGFETRTYTLEGERLRLSVEASPGSQSDGAAATVDFPCSRKSFIQGLQELHMGEWRRRYKLKRNGGIVLDGTQWELELSFADGQRPVRLQGENAYPYNFDRLLELLGVEDALEEVEQDEETCGGDY